MVNCLKTILAQKSTFAKPLANRTKLAQRRHVFPTQTHVKLF